MNEEHNDAVNFLFDLNKLKEGKTKLARDAKGITLTCTRKEARKINFAREVEMSHS